MGQQPSASPRPSHLKKERSIAQLTKHRERSKGKHKELNSSAVYDDYDDESISSQAFMDQTTIQELMAELNPTGDHREYARAVIKITCTSQEPDYGMPWQTLDIVSAVGSGAVIEGGLILTAAHVVAQHTFIEIQKTFSPNKTPASVVSICHDADLALIKPDDASFLKDVQPLQFGDVPQLRDRVFVVGFPIGGEELSVTDGVVSRIEMQPYSHSLRDLFCITVDAAINSGNSGGPVLNSNGAIVGVAFQALEGAENVGHIVPPPIIQHFLEGTQEFGSDYKGFPALGIQHQTLENSLIREYLGMNQDQSGTLVVRVYYGSSADGVLKKGDVILNVDGYNIANNGSIELSSSIRSEYVVALHKHMVGDDVPITVLRNKKVTKLTIKLREQVELAPMTEYKSALTYAVYCGLLFQPLSLELLRHYFGSATFLTLAPKDLLMLCTTGFPTAKRTEVVVVTRTFKDAINTGYESLRFSEISKVNGEEVKSMKDFMNKITKPSKSGMLVLGTAAGGTIVLPSVNSKDFEIASKRIATMYKIQKDRSADLE